MEILLVSENYIKNLTNVSDNINGKLLGPAIRSAQDVELRGVIGDSLLQKLKDLVEDDSIETAANINYKNLLDMCQPFLAYSAISDVVMLTTVKIDNAGLMQNSDEHLSHLTLTESKDLAQYYAHKADYLCKRLQNFILNNRNNYPELTQNDIHSIKANLYSSANCGLWLGGVRGRGIETKKHYTE